MTTTDDRPRRAVKVDAQAQRNKRLEAEALNGALARKRCVACATLGAWKIYNIDRGRGRVRYVRCAACGHCDHVPVVIKENDGEQEQR